MQFTQFIVFVVLETGGKLLRILKEVMFTLCSTLPDACFLLQRKSGDVDEKVRKVERRLRS